MGKEVEVNIQTDGKGKEKSMNIWHRGKTERQTHRKRLTDREEKNLELHKTADPITQYN